MATKRVKPGYKRCPRCAEDVKAAAAVCKHCQYVFTAEDNARQAAIEKKTRRDGAIGLGVLAALGIFVAKCSSDEASRPPTAAEAAKQAETASEVQRYQANGTAAEAVKKRLNDPSSFELVDAQTIPSKTEDGSPGWAVGVTYRAKNGFGGVVTRNAVVSVDQSGDRSLDVVDVDPSPRHHGR